MASCRFPLAGLLVLTTLYPLALSQGVGPDPAAFVRDLYVRYAGTEPTPQMIATWVRELQKGTQPNEVIANILGSEQAFARSQRNNDIWVASLYADVLGRQAEPGATQGWSNRLRELRNDRVKLAREFLKAAGGELSGGASRPPVGTGPQDLPALLLTTTQLLLQSVQTEFPGYDGWMIREQAKTITSSVATASPLLINPASNPRGYAAALIALDSSLNTLRAAIAQSRVPAQGSRMHADQAAQIVAAMAANAGIAPPPGPIGNPGGLSRADARRLAPFAADLSRDATAAGATFRAVIQKNWNTTGLINQVEAFANEADDLRSDIRAGYSVAELVRRTQGLNEMAATVNAVLAKGGVDVRVYQPWYKATGSLTAFTEQIGPGQGVQPPVFPGRPPVILPGRPLPGGITVPPQAFTALDQTIAECDGLIAALTPYTFYRRNVTQLTAEVQDLRNQYAALRQTAATTPTRPGLNAHMDGITRKFNTVTASWMEVKRDPRFRNLPDLGDLSNAQRDVVRQISLAR